MKPTSSDDTDLTELAFSTPAGVLRYARVVLTAALGLAIGCSAEPEMRLTISIVPNESRLVHCRLKISRLRAGDDHTLTYRLPMEIAKVTDVDTSAGRVTLKYDKVKNPNGSFQTLLSMSVEPSSDGTTDLAYDIEVGKPATNAHEGTFGPRFGIFTGQMFASSLDHLVPVLETNGRWASRLTVAVASPAYPLFHTAETAVIERQPDGLTRSPIVAGAFKQVTHHIGDKSIILASVAGQAPSRRDIDRLFASLAPLEEIIPASDEPNLVVVAADEPDGALFTISGPNIIISDLAPVTHSRVLRLSRAVATAFVLRRMDSWEAFEPEDYWLRHALPSFYGARAIAALDPSYHKLLTYDRAVDAASMIGTTRRLSSLYQAGPSLTNRVARSQGYLTLHRLHNLANDAGTSIGELVGALADKSSPFWPTTFKEIAGDQLAPRHVAQVWDKYVNGYWFDQIDRVRHPVPFDASETNTSNGSIFVTARVRGNLELCGCKLNQDGGAARRATVLRAAAARGDGVVDAGGLVPVVRTWPHDRPTRLEAVLCLELAAMMAYDAVAVEQNDFPYVSNESFNDLPLVSANLDQVDSHSLVTVQDRSYAVVGWTDQSRLQPFYNHSWIHSESLRATFDVQDLLDSIEEAARDADGIVVIGHIHPLTIKSIAQSARPKPTLVFSTYENEPSALIASGIVDGLPVVYWPGDNGASIAEVQLERRPDGRDTVRAVSFHRMDDGIPDFASVRTTLDAFYNSRDYLAAVGGDKTLQSPSNHYFAEAYRDSRRNVGSSACAGCHPSQTEHWKKTAHSVAMNSLIRRRRNRNPECVRCHVVAMGTPGGYSLREPDTTLGNVGCEACHGPGSSHISDPYGSTLLAKPTQELCRSCHNDDHSAFSTKPTEYMEAARH